MNERHTSCAALCLVAKKKKNVTQPTQKTDVRASQVTTSLSRNGRTQTVCIPPLYPRTPFQGRPEPVHHCPPPSFRGPSQASSLSRSSFPGSPRDEVPEESEITAHVSKTLLLFSARMRVKASVLPQAALNPSCHRLELVAVTMGRALLTIDSVGPCSAHLN